MASSYLRVALAALALLAILGLPDGAGASHGRNRAHVKKFFHDSKQVLTDTEKCIVANGVPKHLRDKAKQCGTTAKGSTTAYVKCAGLGAFPEAVQSMKCFVKAVKHFRGGRGKKAAAKH